MSNKKSKKRLVDIDVLIDSLGCEDWDIAFKYFLEESDLVDAEEVVRCRECIWSRENLICTNPKCVKSFYGCPVPPEHYCSFGEK